MRDGRQKKKHTELRAGEQRENTRNKKSHKNNETTATMQQIACISSARVEPKRGEQNEEEHRNNF